MTNYNKYVESITPTNSTIANVLKAYLVGGLICIIGQFLGNMYKMAGFNEEHEAILVSVTLIALSVLLTGLGIYQKLADFAGAGTIVPITGFANSVASPAIEYKTEGMVEGIGCKIFTIAGPVILYGIFSSFIVAIIYLIVTYFF